MSQDLLPKVDRGDFQEVFIEDLNWLAPDVKQSVTATDEGGRRVTARNIASYKGLRVWLCDERPGSVLEAELDRLIAKTSTDRLVIFDDDKEQVWRWPVRRAKDGSVTSRLTSHRHKKGDADPKFAARLDIIRMPFDVVLDANAVLGKVREAFDTEAQNESKRASKIMATMYAAVEKAYPQKVDPKVRDHEISVTLARILFLMFGDDTDMWQTDAFRNVIQHEVLPDGSNLAQVLNDLFDFLDTANPDRIPTGFGGFKYVNGGIFEEPIELPRLGKEFRTAILDACAVDWSGISPAIFGSMFQSVRDAETRRTLGEHYTSEENILKTLNPLFLDELREELKSALARDTTQKKVNSLNKLWNRLGEIRFMDPACGCGNFIIVAYRELRAIELQVMEALYDLRDRHQLSLDAKADLKVTLDHFYGIEIDEWPARIAETAMFMMDRQCDLKLEERFGHAPERLPIQREAKIVVGNALRIPWDDVLPAGDHVIVAGNPPFSGRHTRSKEQAADLAAAWRVRSAGHLDYVTAWHALASRYLTGTDGIFAFVSTNSVTQGEPVALMFPTLIDDGWRLKFAHRTFAWTSEATGKATVHCVILGFTQDPTCKPRLFSYETPLSSPVEVVVTDSVNPYLVEGPTIFVRKRAGSPLAHDLPIMEYGSMPNDGGHLLFDAAEAQDARRDPVVAKYLRRYVGASELIHGGERWCLWLTRMDPEDLKRSALLRSRVGAVRTTRLESRNPDTVERAATPHLFWFINQPETDYLCVPQVFSENRPWVTAARLGPEVIANNRVYTCSDPDGFAFAVISSAMFLAWQQTVGGRLESRYNFSGTIVWNNLPLPVVDAGTRAEFIAAGGAILQARDLFPGRSLADLYEPGRLPRELAAAHERLDQVVDGLYGLQGTKRNDTDRQKVLFTEYAKLSSSPASTAKVGVRRGRRS